MAPPFSYGPLLDAVRGLSWPASRSVGAFSVGSHRSSLRGTSAEFSEYRAFRQGDDRRRLDWKVLARTDRAVLRVTRERATLSTLFLIDASASMAFPQPALEKWSLARAMVVALASIAQADGDTVALRIVGGDGIEAFPAAGRRDVVTAWAARLGQATPRGSAALESALSDVRARTRVVLISDFLEAGPALWQAVRQLTVTGSDVHAVHIVARQEADPADRRINGVSPEAAAEPPRTLDAANRDQYRHRFAEWRRELERQARGAGADFIEALTDVPAARLVRRVVTPAPHLGANR